MRNCTVLTSHVRVSDSISTQWASVQAGQSLWTANVHVCYIAFLYRESFGTTRILASVQRSYEMFPFPIKYLTVQ